MISDAVAKCESDIKKATDRYNMTIKKKKRSKKKDKSKTKTLLTVEENCNYCNKLNVEFYCDRCKMVFYCNHECQRNDWGKHQYKCENLRKTRKKMKRKLTKRKTPKHKGSKDKMIKSNKHQK